MNWLETAVALGFAGLGLLGFVACFFASVGLDYLKKHGG